MEACITSTSFLIQFLLAVTQNTKHAVRPAGLSAQALEEMSRCKMAAKLTQ